MTDDDNNNNNNNNPHNNRKPNDHQPPPLENSLLAQTLAAQRQSAAAANRTPLPESMSELLRRIQTGRTGFGARASRGVVGEEDRSLLQILDDAIDLMDRARSATASTGTAATASTSSSSGARGATGRSQPPTRRSHPRSNSDRHDNIRNTRRRRDGPPDGSSDDKTSKGQ